MYDMIRALPADQTQEFIRSLVAYVIPLLEPYQNGVKQLYFISILWSGLGSA
jgi:hypothetical protein